MWLQADIQSPEIDVCSTSNSGHSGSDKTFIGRIERGFDFLGYHFGPDGLSVAKKTVENFVARAIRLYEQEPGETFASDQFGLYARRWVGWARSASYGDRLHYWHSN